MRKGQGISINVIVIAALALIILVILSTIVIQKLGGFNRDTNVCGRTSNQEYCVDKATGCAAGESVNPTKTCLVYGTNDKDPTQVCCLR